MNAEAVAPSRSTPWRRNSGSDPPILARSLRVERQAMPRFLTFSPKEGEKSSAILIKDQSWQWLKLDAAFVDGLWSTCRYKSVARACGHRVHGWIANGTGSLRAHVLVKLERTTLSELSLPGYDARMERGPTHAERTSFSLGFIQAVRRCPRDEKGRGPELCCGSMNFGCAHLRDSNDRKKLKRRCRY